MSRGFTFSGGTSTSSQGSAQNSGSTGSSSSSSSQRFDPLANRIRNSLFDAYQGQQQAQPGITWGAGGGGGDTGPAVPQGPAQHVGPAPLTPAQRQAQIEKNQQRTNGYTGPQITIGGVYSPEMTDRMLNLQQSQNNAQTAGYVAGLPEQLSGRGFAGGNSPLAMELARRANMQNQATNAQLGTEFPFQTAEANAKQRLASESAAQQAYQAMNTNEVGRMQAANQAGSTVAQERIAKLNADVSQRNALLQALTNMAQPLNRSRATSAQNAFSNANSFGKSSSVQSSASPYSFEDFA